jgi:magnesium-transporting ATPase (P-type)
VCPDLLVDSAADFGRAHGWIVCSVRLSETASPTGTAPLTSGLSEAEARQRLEARGKPRKPPTSRSYWTIVRANLFTLPNNILLVLGVVTIALGELADALFLGVVAANAGIGSFQEIRAKKALDRLSALIKPVARVVRGGEERPVDVSEVVVGDLVRVEPGDQVVADGTIVTGESLRLDESILTGESRSVDKTVGDEVLSGSFVVEGVGAYAATAVGEDSYSEKLVGEARTFRHPTSPLQRGVNRLVVTLAVLAVPLVGALVISLVLRNTPFDEGLPTVVAGAVNMVPEGLILLTSIVYVTGALKLSRRGILTQQLNGIESLASADVVCTDKTGTLTEARLRVVSVTPAGEADGQELETEIGRFAASSEVKNGTIEALEAAYPVDAATPSAQVPFSSRWKWSALELDDGCYVLGAPELFELGPLERAVAADAESGRRVVAFARGPAALAGVDPLAGPPSGARLAGLITLAEELRPNIRDTVGYFREQEVELKVLSGDSPVTVGAIAADVGIDSKGPPADGRDLPGDQEGLQRLLDGTAVIGRISPDGKKRIVEALRDEGRYVGMLGDGVNDVPALKASRIAIAQGSGSQMARTVSDLVLVEGDFGSVPKAVGEGRQILRNMQRVSKLFTTKCLFGALTILTLGLTPIEYPFLPRHLSLASFFTLGVPTFILALAPSDGPWRLTTYVRDVVSFSARAAVGVAAGVATAFVVGLEARGLELEEARTVAVSVFVVASLYVVFALEATSARRARWVGALCAGLVGCYVVAIAIPPIRRLFELVLPSGEVLWLIALGIAISLVVLTVVRVIPPFLRGRADGSAGRSAPQGKISDR